MFTLVHSYPSLFPQMGSDGFRWTHYLCQKDPIICAFYPVITPPLPGWIITMYHTERREVSTCAHACPQRAAAFAQHGGLTGPWRGSQGMCFQNWSVEVEVEARDNSEHQNFLWSVLINVWGLLKTRGLALVMFPTVSNRRMFCALGPTVS